jgi:hypothetical protein
MKNLMKNPFLYTIPVVMFFGGYAIALSTLQTTNFNLFNLVQNFILVVCQKKRGAKKD